MKVGTVPKITVGVAVLIGLIFISYIGIRQMNAPTVAERVYLSPWENGTARPQSSPEGLAAQTDSTQNTESKDTQPQIAASETTEAVELIDDLWSQTEVTDTAQSAIEGEPEPEADQRFMTNTSTLLDNTGQSAEDVMDAYVEAWRNADSKAMRPLLTENMRRGSYDHDTEFSIEIREVRNESSDDIPKSVLEAMAEEQTRQLEPPLTISIREMQSQASVVSSEYVGDEFHFLMRMPAPKIPDGVGDQGIEISVPPPPDLLIKMRKEEGMWRVYEGGMLD